MRNLQLCRAVGLEYVREISGVRYGMENYDDKPKCEAEDRVYRKIRRHMIVGLEEYNIQ